jgi:hypothetical protein
LEIVTAELPVFVNTTFFDSLPPIVMLPKFRVASLALSKCVSATPVPLSVTDAAGLALVLLTSATDPFTCPVASGPNTALKEAFFPASMVNGKAKPRTENPAPVTLACEIVMLLLPVFANLKVCELLLPVGTPGKLALDGVTVICAEDGGGVSVPFEALTNPAQPTAVKLADSSASATSEVILFFDPPPVDFFDAVIWRPWLSCTLGFFIACVS